MRSMASESEDIIRIGSRTELFRGPIITLVEREVEGRTYRVVEHPGASCAVPVTPEGKIVLIRQFRVAVGEWIWEVPAGTLEPDESPEDCMAREGHRGDRLGGGEPRIRWAGYSPARGSAASECTCSSRGFRGTWGQVTRTPRRSTSTKWTGDDVRGMMERNEIRDGKSLVALYRYESRYGRA